MKILTGEEVSEELYHKTWELDNIVFDAEFRVEWEKAKEWFYASKKSIIICCDDSEQIVYGYLFPFLLKHTFASKYLNHPSLFLNISSGDFLEKKSGYGDIYLYSTVIVEEYRDIIVPQYNKPLFKVLNEMFVDWICKKKEDGVSIYYVFAEKVSKDGEKYLKSMELVPCFALINDVKYGTLFSASMFSKCDNVKKLIDLYEKSTINDYYKPSLLNNHPYLSIINGELYYKNIKLIDLVEKHGSPLEVAYTEMINEQIIKLKTIFANAIKKANYGGSYKYAYATKANYYSEVVLSAIKSVDLLEVSSAYDVDIVLELVKQGYIKKPYTLICNGFKNLKYFASIKELLNYGINVIPIIENKKEYDLLQQIKQPINVGLRYNSDFESRLIKNEFNKRDEFDNRFGFNKRELELIAKDIYKSKFLTLQVLHFHFGGTISNIDNYLKGYANIFELYCKLKKEISSLQYFDFGGGFPVKYSLNFEFDYEKLVNGIVSISKELSEKDGIEPPVLIGEHGRYTVADHSFYIYKIDFTKKSNEKWWYVINGSIMNMSPDVWGINQDFTILPINLLTKKCIPVCLGGETCDPDDRYYLQNKNIELLLPSLDKDETLYIAIFSIGAYQEIISGIGGVHHCMIPEGNELVIYRDKKTKKLVELKVNEAQTTQEMLSLLSYNDKHYMDKFNN